MATHRSLLPTPGRGLAVAGVLVAGAVGLVALAIAAGWLDTGRGLPRSSNFMPKPRPIAVRISLISFNDFRPKFLVFNISCSDFWTNSRMVEILAFFKQL